MDPSKRSAKLELKEKILKTFGMSQAPEDVPLVEPWSYEVQLLEDFRGKTWQEVPDFIGTVTYGSPENMEPAWLVYYLPGFILATLERDDLEELTTLIILILQPSFSAPMAQLVRDLKPEQLRVIVDWLSLMLDEDQVESYEIEKGHRLLSTLDSMAARRYEL